MTAVSPDSWGRRSRLVAWWAHHESLWGFTSLSMAIALFADDILFPHSILAGVITLGVFIVFFVGYLMQILAGAFHFTYLCVECMQKVPEDAGIRAQRHLGRLRVHHILRGTWVLCISLAMVALLFVTSSPWVHTAIFILFYLDMALESFLSAFHRPLMMYCPWCKWGDGGSHECAPAPDPSMIKTA